MGNPSMQENLRSEIHTPDAIEDRGTSRLVVGVSEEKSARQNSAPPEELKCLEQNERAGSFRQAAAIDHIEAFRHRLEGCEKLQIGKVIKNQLFAFARMRQRAHGAGIGGHESVKQVRG